MKRITGPDAAAALALTAFLVVVSALVRTTQPHARELTWWGIALLVVGGAALAVRRAAPSAAYVGAVGAAVAYLGLRLPGWPVYLGAFAGLFVLVSANPGRRWVVPAALGGLGLAIATGPPENWSAPRMFAVALVWAAVAVLADRFAQARREVSAAAAAQSVAEERLRIAQELHDVLSHSLAAISLQAGVGLHLLSQQPAPPREALVAIRQISNEALGQARQALAAVREPGAAPGLTEIPGLVDSFRASGLAVEFHLALDRPTVPPLAGSAAYRIIQEALTNVLRHAGPDVRVAATVREDLEWLRIEVRDNGASNEPAGPPGLGLRGMKERVHSLGGACSAGFEPGSGFVVRARLPLPSTP